LFLEQRFDPIEGPLGGCVRRIEPFVQRVDLTDSAQISRMMSWASIIGPAFSAGATACGDVPIASARP
jgi:hypothetical protein